MADTTTAARLHGEALVSGLAEFLLARIAEDEEAARAAGSGPWHWDQGYGDMCNDAECPFGSLMQVKENGQLYQLMDVHGYDVHAPWEGAAHIARHDPARVLAECEAKRRIVAWHRLIDGLDTEDKPVRGCCNCIASGAVAPYLIAGPCMTLRLLALPYADHEAFQEEWRP